MPAAVSGGTSNSSSTMPSTMAPKRAGSGSKHAAHCPTGSARRRDRAAPRTKKRVPRSAAAPCASARAAPAARNHQADPAAKVLRRAVRQMKLRGAGIDPHVVHAGHHVRVARQAQVRHIELRRHQLVRHGQIQMLEVDDVAEILDSSIKAQGHWESRSPDIFTT